MHTNPQKNKNNPGECLFGTLFFYIFVSRNLNIDMETKLTESENKNQIVFMTDEKIMEYLISINNDYGK